MRIRLGILLLTLAAIGTVAASAQAAGPATEPRTITVAVRYSKFAPATIEVPAGVPVTFVLRNDDPIDHEWLVGDAAFHQRHRTGTETAHGDRPDEVSMPPFTTRTTTLTFDRPGTYAFVCHFPGHETYGMVGALIVR